MDAGVFVAICIGTVVFLVLIETSRLFRRTFALAAVALFVAYLALDLRALTYMAAAFAVYCITCLLAERMMARKPDQPPG